MAFAEDLSVGQKRIREKTAEELQAERVEAALNEAGRTGRAPGLVVENPGQFLRDMYEVWHRQGGKEGGRWRNSIRKMREQWLTGRNHVPSLHQKLMGRIKLTRSDARALIGLFLERWRYVNGSAASVLASADGYAAFDVDIQLRIRDALLIAAFPSKGKVGARSILMPPRPTNTRAHADDIHVDAFIDNYRQCDALVTFSRNRVVVDPTPPESMKNFFYLFNAFYEEDRLNAKSKRVFIWIVDFGRRLYEEDQSFREYFNSGLLSLLFQSFYSFDSERDRPDEYQGKILGQLRIFDSQRRRARWQWFLERSVVIVENLRWEEFGQLYGDEESQIAKIRLRDSGVTAQHILPLDVPPRWGGYLKNLGGRKVNVNDISFTNFYKKEGWDPIGDEKKIKRYAHARTIMPSEKGISDAIIESIELPSPGRSYDEACDIIYLSALYRLSNDHDLDSEEMTAFAYLRKLGFNVIKVDDFMRLFQPVAQLGEP